MSALGKRSVLWSLTGVMALIYAAAVGGALSGAATALAALAELGEGAIAAVAVLTLLAGFALALGAGLADLAALARRGAPSLPLRWTVGSIAALFVAGPFWNLCVVHVQEPLTGTDAVRTLFDNVLYGLLLASVIPLGLGVPWGLARLRGQSRTIAPGGAPELDPGRADGDVARA